MAVRTVRVILTGTATPYISAMRTAAATTTSTAASMSSSMRTASARGSTAMSSMARAASVSTARSGASFRGLARTASLSMTTMAARSGAAIRSALAPAAPLAARAGSAFTRLGAVGSAAMAGIRSAAASSAAALATAMPGAAARASAAMAAVRTAATASAAGVASRWAAASAALGRVGAAASAAAASASASWSAAAARISAATTAAAAAASRAMGSMRLAAYAAGASMLGVATGAKKSLEAVRTASLGLVAVFGLAALAAARFEKSMSEVRAVTGGSAGEMKKLEAAALQAGQSTVYSATEAANAEAELARAGISTADIIGGALRGSLDLAASGQLELGEAAIISAQAMNAFKLSGGDVGHIADVISAGAGKSATNVHDMGQAFRQAALLSSQTGLSLEQTVGTLSLFAQNALTGSDAGTSLKVMLQRLVPNSKEAAATMEQIGLKAYDAQGRFIGLTALAGNMRSAFSQLTPEARNAAMATIFGSDAVRAATILYEAGAQGVTSWTNAVNDSGYAGRVAATMTDNLAGDLERLKGALETALISSGSAANGVLREMAQALTAVVGWYSQLSPGVQKSVTVMAGLLGVLGLVGSSLLLMLPRIMAVRAELVALGVTAARVRGSMLLLGRMSVVVAGIAAVTYGVSKLTRLFREAPPDATRLSNSLVDLAQKGKSAGELAKVFGANFNEFGEAVKRIAHPGGLDRIEDFFSTFDPAAEGGPSLEAAREKITALDEALSGLVRGGATKEAASAFAQMAAEAEKNGTSAEKLKTLLPQYSEALTAVDTQNKVTAGSQKDLADATGITADQMADTRSEAEKLSDALKTLNGVAISAAEKEISFRSSLADLTEAARENGLSLDINSEKGRKVKSAFLDAAQAAMAHAEAVADQQGSVEAGNAVLEQDIALLRRQMEAAHFSTGAIESLIGAYAKLPSEASTRVSAPGATGATAELQALHARLAALPQGKTLTIKAPTGQAIGELQALGYKVERLPNGFVKISAPTGAAISSLGYLQARIDALRGRTIDITTHYRTVGQPAGSAYPPSGGRANREADGGYIRRYASGGDVQWMPWGGAVYGPGTETSDSVPTWLSRGEYVIKAASVRKYGMAMFDRLNAGRYAGGGAISYTPTQAPMLRTPQDVKGQYDDLVKKLAAAWKTLNAAMATSKQKTQALRDAEKNLQRVRSHRHTANQLLAAEKKLRDARAASAKATAAVTAARGQVYNVDKALGLAKGAQTPKGFNLGSYGKLLGDSLKQTANWRRNLDRIQGRGGKQVRDILEQMGEDGYALVEQLARAGDKQFKDIVKKLKDTAGVAGASLADFTKQVSGANKANQQFSNDLQTLAARGYGDLAQALAGMGGDEAAALARQAVTGGAAGVVAANNAAKAAGSQLTGEELSAALTLLSVLRGGPGRGFAELIAAGLDVGSIKGLAPRIMAQIKGLPEANKRHFLEQLGGQSGGAKPMARGAILTQPTHVLAAEAGYAESLIPINASARSRSLLMSTARLMGYDARPASQWGSSGGGGAPAVQHITKNIEVHLHGAKQSSAAQAADIARQLSFIG